MIVLGVLPAAVLMFYIFKADKKEKEPVDLLAKLFLWGVCSTISAVILESIGDTILDIFFWNESLIYIILENFLVVALAEEFGKYFVVKKLAWKHPAFNYTFDAVVYAVFASLGFAALENVLYLTDADLTTAVMRGILAVPGHAIDAVFMGAYFGRAKRCEALNDNEGTKSNLSKALWIPVLTHGFYDFCLSVDSFLATIAFFVFEIVITIYAIRKVKQLSNEDTAIFAGEYPGAGPVREMFANGMMHFDPATGRPVMYSAKPAMNYDPMTGKPLNMPNSPQYGMNFDPMTGKPLNNGQNIQAQNMKMRYDPVTGEPIT
ncbi:MAG: PrsW family intramembrane metalloprotease [Butyrivibrio sp.]|nr:PrsW family intramembrane metalloprotease [bacterium]MBQ9589028.1 PrsW family intramembrane metalloprotease [Butyrivibrio sp.]